MNEHHTIAELVRYFRKRAGLSQKQLAELAQVGKTVVFDIEKRKESIQLNSLLKVFKALGIRLNFKTPFAEKHGIES